MLWSNHQKCCVVEQEVWGDRKREQVKREAVAPIAADSVWRFLKRSLRFSEIETTGDLQGSERKDGALTEHTETSVTSWP